MNAMLEQKIIDLLHQLDDKEQHHILTYIQQIKDSKQSYSHHQTLADYFMQANPEVSDIELEIPQRSTTQRPQIEF